MNSSRARPARPIKAPETLRSEAVWALPRYDDGGWLENYYMSASGEWRDVLMRALAPLAPFPSVCELGCHCGPNLKRLRETFGECYYYVGVDVNASALAFGRLMALAAGYPDDSVVWLHRSLLDLVVDEQPLFDLALTSSCLAVIPPADIARAVHTCLSLSRRVVAIQEPNFDTKNGEFQQWRHDYDSLVLQARGGSSFRWARPGDGTVLVGVRH